MLKYVLTNNGSEWMKEFDVLCQDYRIMHQFTAPMWPKCNGMVEHLMQTVKRGLTVMSSTNTRN